MFMIAALVFDESIKNDVSKSNKQGSPFTAASFFLSLNDPVTLSSRGNEYAHLNTISENIMNIVTRLLLYREIC